MKANEVEINKLEAEKARVEEARDLFLSSIEETLDQSFHRLHNKDDSNEEESKLGEDNTGVRDVVQPKISKETIEPAKPQADKIQNFQLRFDLGGLAPKLFWLMEILHGYDTTNKRVVYDREGGSEIKNKLEKLGIKSLRLFGEGDLTDKLGWKEFKD